MVPYLLNLDAQYEFADCPPIISDPTDCVTEGLQGSDLPFPGDEVTAKGPEWKVLTIGGYTGRPGLLVADYSAGHVLVDLAHPSPEALCPYTDQGFARMVGCCPGPPTSTQPIHWGKIKALYK